jgi:hypothetical protein
MLLRSQDSYYCRTFDGTGHLLSFDYIVSTAFFLVASNKLCNANEISVRNLKIKRQIGRPKRRWEDNIKIYLKGLEWEGVNWINVAKDRDK